MDKCRAVFGPSAKSFYRNATFISLIVLASACQSMGSAHADYAAYGYLTPGPSGDPELIGVFDSIEACEAAAGAWASRQVVGNPVFTECLPVDRH